MGVTTQARSATSSITMTTTTKPQQRTLREIVTSLSDRVKKLEEEVITLKTELHEYRTNGKKTSSKSDGDGEEEDDDDDLIDLQKDGDDLIELNNDKTSSSNVGNGDRCVSFVGSISDDPSMKHTAPN